MANNLDVFLADGCVVLKGFYSRPEIERALFASKAVVHRKTWDVVVDDLDTGERALLGMVPDARLKSGRFKVNDLHLTEAAVRSLALSRRMSDVLKPLLGQSPVLCNSLFFEKGSAQPAHVDSLFVTPQTSGHLIWVWIALEDVHADAGPLEYYPGSHNIEQMKFGNGGYHCVPDEMPDWQEHTESHVKRLRLKKKRFAAKIGDVFVGHAHLLHGGAPIADAGRTRKALLFHYYALPDCADLNLVPEGGAHWVQRPPHDVGGLGQAYREFSESAYLALYPDVANAVSAGKVESAWAHYVMFGRQEGRLGSFSETAYLSQNPDVAQAVSGGLFKSGLDHYLQFGHSERRVTAVEARAS